MSKRVRTLLFSGIAVLVLVALLVVLLILPDPNNDKLNGGTTTTAPQEDTSIRLWDKTQKDAEGNAVTVKEVTVKNENGSYTLIGDKEAVLLLKSHKDLPHAKENASALSTQLQSVVVSRLIEENPATAEKFGFDTEKGPAVEVSATYSDGSSFAFELGDANPSGGGVYLRVKGGKAVYLYSAASAAVFYYKEGDYLTKTPITAPTPHDTEDAASDTVIVREVELSGSVRPSTIYFQVSGEPSVEGQIAASSSGYYVKKPYFRNVNMNSELIQASAYSLFTAADVAAVNPTAAQLAEFGLTKPYSQCAFTLAVQHPNETKNEDDKTVTTFTYYNVFKYVVKLGDKTEDGLRYAVVYQEGKLFPIVYLVNEKDIAWASAQYDDIADNFLFYTYIRNVKSMKLTLDGTATTFNLQHLDADADETLAVTANGKTYKAADFRVLYQELMGVQRSSATTDEPKGDAVFELVIETNKTDIPGTSLKLYHSSASKYLVRHSTGETYLVDAKTVEPFFEHYRNFLAQ